MQTVLPGWANNLNRLRSFGSHRKAPSLAYRAINGKLSRGQILLDIGCGESNDRIIAKSRGVVAYGIDLFPPKKHLDGFVQADARRLPFVASSVNAAICQAAISLIPPDDRFYFYVEIFRVLKPYGYFSVLFQPLVDGWRVNPSHESERLIYLRFHSIRAGLFQKGGF